MKNLPALPNQDKRLAEVLRLHQLASAAAAQMAVAAAKAGLELKALKKDLGHGNWEDYFGAHLAKHGLSDRTAQRYMALADGLKGKALKNDTVAVLALLDVAPSQLKKADQVKLTKVMAKAADGATLTELYTELGIVKKPQGSGAKGGSSKKPSASDDTAPASKLTPVEVIAEGHRARVQNRIDLLTEDLTDTPWLAATREKRAELHGLLVDVAAALSKHLK